MSDVLNEEVDNFTDDKERLVDEIYVSVPLEWPQRPEQPLED